MGNFESPSQSRRSFSIGVSLPDFQDVAGCQFGATLSFPTSYALRIEMCRVACAYCSALAPFRDHVRHIRSMVAKEEMGRVHAGPNVAAMKDVLPERNPSVCEIPRHAVRSLRASADDEGSIALIGSRCPQPAWAKFWEAIRDRSVLVDLLPEPFCRVLFTCLTGASRRANTSGMICPGGMKRAAALFAGFVRSTWVSHSQMIPRMVFIGIAI